MGLKFLWNTNTAIYYLQQQFPPDAEKFIDDVLKDGQPVISAITNRMIVGEGSQFLFQSVFTRFEARNFTKPISVRTK